MSENGRDRSIRARLGLLALFAILAVASFAGLRSATDKALGTGPSLARGKGGKPLALANRLQHLEKLRRALPGDQGMLSGGPGSLDEEKFQNQAYPDSDIPLVRIERARAAFHVADSHGHHLPSQWVPLGPTTALYQESEFRTGYVPSQYVASGRVTSMAIGPHCGPHFCRLWVAAAGGGVWRTDNALASSPKWKFLTASIGINAVGAISVDENDVSGNTVWIGTGEANASSDSAAGVGLYRSTDGGDSWTGPLGSAEFKGRAVGSVVVDPTNPHTVYVGTTRGVRGVSSVSGGGVSLIPGAAAWGVYKSTDGGASFSYVHNGAATVCVDASANFINTANNLTACSPRGVRRVVLDPSDPQIVYAASYARGVWRSNDGGATWAQINPSLGSTNASMRPDIAVTTLANGKTRMYVGEGASGSPTARLFRSDDVAAGIPVFTNLSSANPADSGFGSFNYCTGQCWYDNFVTTPPGYPDVVYLGGSHQYGETGGISNGRGVVLSTDAGVSFTDMTEDADLTTGLPNGLHPDHHALVTNPNHPYQFFSGSDGGVMRSNGRFSDTSARCATRGLAGASLARCEQLLSRVPTRLASVNKGLNTLQFQSLSVNPRNRRNLQGGTQDNGTFETSGSTSLWNQTMWGDGGQSGFDVADPTFRFHTFFSATPDVNFSNGAIADWNWISDRIYNIEPQSFYIPMISDPVVSQTLFAGLAHVWRTKTHGRGAMTVPELRARCNEFTGDFTVFCGDWEPLGAVGYVPPPPYLTNPSPGTRLITAGALYGTDRSGGVVAAVERAHDSSTLWAATSAGRVFVSKNADAEPASAVVFTRIDPFSALDPGRFVSGIHIDPANPNHAWIAYSGFSAATPTTPGHIFEVTYDPGAGTATWTSLEFDLGDLPLNDVAVDHTGQIFVASDFGVLSLVSGSWAQAAAGLPAVEVAGLTIVPSTRRLYAATHGLGAWSLTLP